MKVCTIVGTRPEVIKLSKVIPALDRYFDHTLIHTGQNHSYELRDIFFEEMSLRKPDVSLDCAGSSLADTMANMFLQLDNHLSVINPDAVLILGDTNSCLAAAYTAKRRHIPLFHMEAGNRSFDDRVPEEINRRAIDHISDINLPYTEAARLNLLREGLPADRVIKTGSPMKEVLVDRCYTNICERENLRYGRYFLVSCHREENTESVDKLISILNTLAEEYVNFKVIVSVHPRIKVEMENRAWELHRHIILHKPFGFFDYATLETNAHVVLSDSGTITEESSILGFPALNIRETHERQEGMDEGSVIMTGLNKLRVIEGLKILEARSKLAFMKTPQDYRAENVSEKVPVIIQSYVGYVNRVVYGRKQ